VDKKARKAFLSDFEHWYNLMFSQLNGVADSERARYVFTLFSRFLFLYFVQCQGLLEKNQRYLSDKLEQCQAEGIPYHRFLIWLLQAIDTPAYQRPARPILGRVPYLRLFPDAPLPESGAMIPDQPFGEMLSRLQWLTFDLEEQDEEKRAEVTPAILGHLVETFIALKSPYEQKKTGSFYTPEEICVFISKSTCYPVIQRQFEVLTGRQPSERIPAGQAEASLDRLIGTIDAREAGVLLFVILPTLSILDPAVGAANFLVSALRLVARVYKEIFAFIEGRQDMQHPALLQMLDMADSTPGGRDYFIKKRILSRNIFGVDILQEPLDISRMRLCLALLSQVKAGTAPEPFPQLTFCLPRGNSLVGIDRITERERLQLARYPRYDDLVSERRRLIGLYCNDAFDRSQSSALYAQIQACRDEAYGYLNEILTERVATNGKKRKNRKKDSFTLQDLERLDPFHWTYDFDDIMNRPSWTRCDPQETQVVEVEGQVRGIRFGPGSR
jgi:hypothetical protein